MSLWLFDHDKDEFMSLWLFDHDKDEFNHCKERVNTRTIEISIREPVGNIDDIKSFKISDMFSAICFNSRTYGKRV